MQDERPDGLLFLKPSRYFSNLFPNLKVHQLLIFITGWICRLHLPTSGSCSVPCVLFSTSHPSIPRNVILPSMSLEGVCFGMKRENMTYLAAVTTLRGEPPHNKNNQLSFVHNPRFHCTYTTLGWMEELMGGETESWLGWKEGGEQAGAGGFMWHWRKAVEDRVWSDALEGYRGRWVGNLKGQNYKLLISSDMWMLLYLSKFFRYLALSSLLQTPTVNWWFNLWYS